MDSGRDGRERGGEWTKAKAVVRGTIVWRIIVIIRMEGMHMMHMSIDIDVHVHDTRTRRAARTVVHMGDGMG